MGQSVIRKLLGQNLELYIVDSGEMSLYNGEELIRTYTGEECLELLEALAELLGIKVEYV